MKRTLVALTVAAAAAAWPAGAGATGQVGGGVVVGRLASRVLVASPAGVVRAYRGHAVVGSRVVLRRGAVVVVGRARSARIDGTVVSSAGSTMFLSSGAHLLALHVMRTTRRLSSASDGSPPLAAILPAGQVVSTQVLCDNGQLDEQSVQVLGAATASTLPIQATVAAVGTGTVTLTVNGQTLTLGLPAGLTLPSSIVGQAVTLDVTIAAAPAGDDDAGQPGPGVGVGFAPQEQAAGGYWAGGYWAGGGWHRH